MLNIKQLEQHIEQAMLKAKVPGVALIIFQDDYIVEGMGLGVTSVEYPEQVTPETLFRIGSITKPMTALLITQLVEMGKLDLDVPVREYVPDIQFSVPEYTDQITLRRLLSHNAGLQTSHAPFGCRDSSALEAYIREDFPKYMFVAPPGVLYSYSNPGIRLAGYVAEKVMGQPYTHLMQTFIFEPLNMRRTTFDTTIAMTYSVAQSHDLQADGKLVVQHQFADNAAQYASGGVISNVLDMRRFVVDGLGSLKLAQIMQVPQVAQFKADDAFYGLGLNIKTIKGIKRIGHDGSISTFGSKMVYLPDRRTGVVILFNRAAGFWSEAADIVETVIDSLLDLPSAHPTTTINPSKSHWKTYTGSYLGLERGYAIINIEDDILLLIWNNERYLLKAVKDDLYAAKGVDVGFVGGYLMIDGSPLARTDRHPVQLAPDPAYSGLYRGVDELKIRVEDGQMWVFSEEVGRELICLPLDEKTFASSIGILEFEGQTLRQGKAYLNHRVSAR